MTIYFEKYQGTGNDFILIDNLSGKYNALQIQQIKNICDRKYGVGADGLIKINKVENYDFEVEYFNSDGSKSFCGNGTRCAVAFVSKLGIIKDEYFFFAIDGEHRAKISNDLVSLKMADVNHVEEIENNFVLNTGSPHFIHYVENIHDFDIVKYGKQIRFSTQFSENGINVNAVESIAPNKITMATYERGVEDETLSCGTGVTAASLIHAFKNKTNGNQSIHVETKGGDLLVEFDYSNNRFENIWLVGPAKFVFIGEFEIE